MTPRTNTELTVMGIRVPSVVLLCFFVMFTHQYSPDFNSTYQTLLIPCLNDTTYFTFPSYSESFLRILTDPHRRWKIKYHRQCFAWLQVPAGKYISLKISPFEPRTSCKGIGVKILIDERTQIESCDRHFTFHSNGRQTKVNVYLQHINTPFSVTIAIRALDEYGGRYLHVIHHTNVSGVITPYLFDGYSDYAQNMYALAVLNPPPDHTVMLSFPHFHLKPNTGCTGSILLMVRYREIGGTLWRHCGNIQLPLKLHASSQSFKLLFRTKDEKGYTGFKLRFSFHSQAEVPEKLPTNNATTAVFNCSVPFYATFSQHLECNLETECANAEDEAICPYWQGACQADFLSAGGKCYKYTRTRKRMTWLDASSVCLKQGLTLTSFPTFEQKEVFREGILEYAPTTFKTFIGLRTSDSLLPAIYREVWQWSSGIIAYYVDVGAQQLYKPTCGSFAALSRDKISTTLCGFYEYMHYIFCESITAEVKNESAKVSLFPTVVISSLRLENSPHFVTCSEGHFTLDFLSCDHASGCSAKSGAMSCVTHSSIKSESGIENVEVLMYVCDSQTQTIHYTQVCDHQTQCFDSSDESFCIYQKCAEKQCLNQQCVTTAHWCDGMIHCSDGSDEACPQFMTVFAKPPSDSTVSFHVVVFDSHGGYRYIPQGKEYPVCPFTHFMCANYELCLPVYLRCNRVYDCSDKEDEDNCTTARCPGFYRCRQSSVCVHSDHICDGVFQCPQQDDELLCQLVCPDNCLCQGLAFVCYRPFPVQDFSGLRYLDSSGSGLSPHRLILNHYLIRLSLSRCSIRTLPVFNLPNLKYLYLDNNLLTNVNMDVFLKLLNLNVLSLSGNPVMEMVTSDSNALLEKVHSIDLSNTKLKYFESVMLWNIRNVKSLNMSHSMLKVIGDTGFRYLTLIESLDLRGSELKEYPLKMLKSLSCLRILFSDVYKLCCQEVLPKEFNAQNCYTVPDEISSCKDLLRSDIVRLFLWIACCFALFGNAGSFAAKIYMQKGKPQSSFNVFIAHLNVADFFMGLYLILIGSADQVYRGTYLWHDKEWRTCFTCKTAGVFSLLSCEMSAFIVCFITLDRLLVIRFPFSHVRFSRTSAQVVCASLWMIDIVLAALPLLPVTSHWEFYSQTDICIPLPVTKQNFKGHFYSFGILIVFNFILFVLIAVGQMFIYRSIRANSMVTDQKAKRESTVAKRLLTVVMSDFLCWFPICLFGLLASNGMSIPVEINVIMAIFALPLNSALNPFLYTFNLLMEKRRRAAEERLLKILQTKLKPEV